MKKARILLIEDEESLRKIIHLNLELESFEVVSVNNGAEAITKLQSEHYDLIILDLMLPKISGLDILKNFRVRNTQSPVIIISAKDSSSDRIKGLKEGADDYLSKPFEIEELLIRIQNLLKRNTINSTEKIEDVFCFGQNTINFKTYRGKHHANQFDLGEKEVLILKYLISKKNEVVSRQEILKTVWGYDVFPSTRTIDNFISSLRKHFEEDPKNPSFIKSVHGVGYKFQF